MPLFTGTPIPRMLRDSVRLAAAGEIRHMARLIDDTGSRLLETAKVLFGHADFSAELAAEIRRNGGADRAVQALLREFQCDESSAPASFPIWRTLQIGGKTKDQLIAEIEAAGMKIYDYARSMLAKEAFTTSPSPIEIRLVRVTVAELGFKKGATTKNVWKRAQDLGLTLCPAEVGPHLRLADAEQVNGEWYWIGMETIADAGGYPCVFKVEHDDGGRWLLGDVARPGDHWDAGDRLVFVPSGK